MKSPKKAKQGKSPAAPVNVESEAVTPKKNGRPSKCTPDLVAKVCEGLRKGTPLTVICSGEGMPCDDTVRAWCEKFPEVSRDIGRARAAGFDQIAMDALAIADEVTAKDTIETNFGGIPNKEWILRSKLRVETRLRLLAKWDPKRYGDKLIQELTGKDGGPIQTEDARKRSDEETAAFAALLAAADKQARPSADASA